MNARILIRWLEVSCVCIGIGTAQTSASAQATISAQAPIPTPALKPRFAVEIPNDNGVPPGYVYSGYKDMIYEAGLHRLAKADPGIRHPSAIMLKFKEDGDLVTITATAYYGEIDPRKTTPISRDQYSVDKLESEALGSYSGKLNDAVTISAMARVGLQPMTVKIVTAQSDNPYHPQTRSNAPSLQIDYSPENRVMGIVTVHNLSTKVVTAVHLGSLEDGDVWLQPEDIVGRKVSIVPGASYGISVTVIPRGRLVNGKYVEKPLPATMTLGAALFADGSYEGDLQLAAELAAHQFGIKEQRQRILGLIAPIFAEPDSDDKAKAERIRATVKQLTDDSDAQTIADFRAQFPSLSDSGVAKAQTKLSSGMQNEKDTFDYCITQFETNSSSKTPSMSLEHWLTVSCGR
jgi:hypothetical protein